MSSSTDLAAPFNTEFAHKRKISFKNVCLAISLLLFCFVLIYPIIAYTLYNRVELEATSCSDCTSSVVVNGYELNYREAGVASSLPVVFLLHGGPAHSFESFKDGFDFLSLHTRVVFYDQRGSGHSQVKTNKNDYSIEELVEELEELRVQVCNEKIIIIGHSFGGVVAQRYAIKYGSNVDKVILVGSPVINNGFTSKFFLKYIGPTLYSFALGIPPKTSTKADQWFTESLLDEKTRLFNQKNIDFLKESGPCRFVPWREISLSVAGSTFDNELKSLSAPFMFIYGVADIKFTGKATANYLCSLVPNCQAIEMKNSGHWPYLEEPSLFQSIVLDFVGH
ncbi:hypothetical protein RCL1_007271 [Eukaryota sp. TZLM3-RCL]